jgi:hypothetical protein
MAIDYSKWSEADLKALAKNDYNNLSTEALQQLTSETPVSQGGEPGIMGQAANLGGQVLGGLGSAYEHTAKPVVDYLGNQIMQHPLAEAGFASSYLAPLAKQALSENLYNKLIKDSRLEQLAEIRRNLMKKIFSPPAEPGTGPGGPFTSAGSTPPNPNSTSTRIPIAYEPGSTGSTPPPPSSPPGAMRESIGGIGNQGMPLGQPPQSQPSSGMNRFGQLAQQYAPVLQQAAPYLGRAAGVIGGLTYSPSLNTGEQEQLRRQQQRIDQGIRDEAARRAGIPVSPQ